MPKDEDVVQPPPHYHETTYVPKNLHPNEIDRRVRFGHLMKSYREEIRSRFTPGCRIEFHPRPGAATIRRGKGTFLELKNVRETDWVVYYQVDGYKSGKKMDSGMKAFLADNPEKIEE